MPNRWLTAVPVYNEAKHVRGVLAQIRRYSSDILVVNDGSTDGTARLLDAEPDIARIDHAVNRGYGAALISAFRFALDRGFDGLFTMDCDGQHEPSRIPVLLEAIHDCDIVSGSRYYRDFRQDTPAPNDRRSINAAISRDINDRFGWNLTDAFCGIKEIGVPRLYLDPTRAFGGVMNDPEQRLAYYRGVLAAAELDELPTICQPAFIRAATARERS